VRIRLESHAPGQAGRAIWSGCGRLLLLFCSGCCLCAGGAAENTLHNGTSWQHFLCPVWPVRSGIGEVRLTFQGFLTPFGMTGGKRILQPMHRLVQMKRFGFASMLATASLLAGCQAAEVSPQLTQPVTASPAVFRTAPVETPAAAVSSPVPWTPSPLLLPSICPHCRCAKACGARTALLDPVLTAR